MESLTMLMKRKENNVKKRMFSFLAHFSVNITNMMRFLKTFLIKFTLFVRFHKGGHLLGIQMSYRYPGCQSMVWQTRGVELGRG